MQVRIEIDKATRQKMEKVFADLIKTTGKTAEEGVGMIAKSAARRLIHTVQPYGVNQAVGEKYKKSIAKQVSRAVRNANVIGIDGDASTVHRRARDRKGQVPKSLKTDGQFKRRPIETEDREAQIRKAQAKAGRAKGAWLEAANGIGGKTSGIARWISDHATGGYGSCRKTGEGMKHKITLENRTPYLSKIQTDRDVAQATVTGMKNAFKQMQKIIDKEIEKANRALQ